jgi:hypothetical protein
VTEFWIIEHVVVCGPMTVAAAAPVVRGKGSLTCPASGLNHFFPL